MKSEFIDCYSVLGVSSEADNETIKKSFDEKSKLLDSDALNDEDFKNLVYCYEILSNPKTRNLYDIKYWHYTEFVLRRKEKERQEELKKEKARKVREEQEKKIKKEAEEKEKNEKLQQEIKLQQVLSEIDEIEHENCDYSHEIKMRFYERLKKDNSSNFHTNFVKSFKEVKKEEKKNSFKKRNVSLNKALYGTNEFDSDSLLLNIKNGAIHVFFEGFYHLHKLSYIKEDSCVKYVIRNRKLIAALACGSFMMLSPISPIKINSGDDNRVEAYDDMDTEVIVVGGLSLEEIASSYNTDVDTIISLNKDYIIGTVSNYYILSDTLYVPKSNSKVYKK